MLETSVFLKAMLKQMLFQGKSEQLKLWVIFQQNDWTITQKNLTQYLLQWMEWRLTAQQRSSPSLWSGSQNQRPTPIFMETLSSIVPCLNLSLAPTYSPSSLKSLDDYSIFLHWQPPAHLKILYKWAGGIYFYWATKMHKVYTLNDLLRRCSLV